MKIYLECFCLDSKNSSTFSWTFNLHFTTSRSLYSTLNCLIWLKMLSVFVTSHFACSFVNCLRKMFFFMLEEISSDVMEQLIYLDMFLRKINDINVNFFITKINLKITRLLPSKWNSIQRNLISYVSDFFGNFRLILFSSSLLTPFIHFIF